MQQPTDSTLLSWLESGNEQAVDWLYRMYRSEFINWAMRKYSLEENSSVDVFQETVISFYYNARQGKLSNLQSSIKTYLFAIGRNLILKHFRKHQLEVATDDFGSVSLAGVEMNILESNEQKSIMARLLNKLGEPCQQLLTLFYFNNYTMESIAETMGYKNDKVAKSQKVRCLKELKKEAQLHQTDLL